MTGRQRLGAVLAKKPTEGLPWTIVVDDTTLSAFPEELRRNYGIDFCRHIGCDIFLLNGWNTPYEFQSPQLCWAEGVKFASREENGKSIQEWKTPRGILTAVYQGSHPAKYPVNSIEAVKIYREMWEGARYVERDDAAALAALDALIGDDGVVTRFWGTSPVPRLLQLDMGTENFYYLYCDYPEEIDGLINCMHECELDAFAHLANGPWESVVLAENTSTLYISPEIYEKYNMPHQRDFVEKVKARGKAAILHMCGHVHGILDLIKETGCDGIHALTPPPTGNTPWEDALDMLGEDLIIFGCLDPTVFISGDVDRIGTYLDAHITPRLREGNFVLAPFADGIAVGLDRFQAVQRWMEAHARA